MSLKVSLACVLALAAGAAAGCATSDPYASASPHSTNYPRTDGPQIDNADAAGPASVPGTRTGVAPDEIESPAASPVIIVPPSPAASPVIVVPPAQPR